MQCVPFWSLKSKEHVLIIPIMYNLIIKYIILQYDNLLLFMTWIPMSITLKNVVNTVCILIFVLHSIAGNTKESKLEDLDILLYNNILVKKPHNSDFLQLNQ